MGDGSSSIWGNGSYFGDNNGPNAATSDNGDNLPACSSLQAAFGGSWALATIGMSCYDYSYGNNQQAVRSMHANGAFVCLVDGSVHWISDYIDVAGNWSSNPVHLSVWDCLLDSADSQVISADAF